MIKVWPLDKCLAPINWSPAGNYREDLGVEKVLPQKMRGEEKKMELQLSWKWMEGCGQGDENKLYVEDWRNYGISAHLWALRDRTFPARILTSLEAQTEENESFAVQGLEHAWPYASGMKIIESFSLWKRLRERSSGHAFGEISICTEQQLWYLGHLLFPTGNQHIPLELPGNFLFQTKALGEEEDLAGQKSSLWRFIFSKLTLIWHSSTI